MKLFRKVSFLIQRKPSSIRILNALIFFGILAVSPGSLVWADSIYVALDVRLDSGEEHSFWDRNHFFETNRKIPAHITVLRAEDFRGKTEAIVRFIDEQLKREFDQVQVKPVFFYADQVSLVPAGASTYVVLKNSSVPSSAPQDALESVTNRYLTECVARDITGYKRFVKFTSSLERLLMGEDREGFTHVGVDRCPQVRQIDSTYPHVTLDKIPTETGSEEVQQRLATFAQEDLKEDCGDQIRYRVVGYSIRYKAGGRHLERQYTIPEPQRARNRRWSWSDSEAAGTGVEGNWRSGKGLGDRRVSE